MGISTSFFGVFCYFRGRVRVRIAVKEGVRVRDRPNLGGKEELGLNSDKIVSKFGHD